MLEKEFDEWMDLENAMRDEISELLDLIEENSSSMALRRAFVRAVWAAIEGSVHGAIEFIETAKNMANEPITFPSKQSMSASQRIKNTLKETAAILTPNWKIDFGTKGWEEFVDGREIRDRITHPKTADDFAISEKEFEAAKLSITWYFETITELQKRAIEHAEAQGS